MYTFVRLHKNDWSRNELVQFANFFNTYNYPQLYNNKLFFARHKYIIHLSDGRNHVCRFATDYPPDAKQLMHCALVQHAQTTAVAAVH